VEVNYELATTSSSAACTEGVSNKKGETRD
jgi:hypothetical protein